MLAQPHPKILEAEGGPEGPTTIKQVGNEPESKSQESKPSEHSLESTSNSRQRALPPAQDHETMRSKVDPLGKRRQKENQEAGSLATYD